MTGALSLTRRRLMALTGQGSLLLSNVAFAQALPDPAKAAEAFLTVLATKGADAGRLAASPAFRVATSQAHWRGYVRASALDRYRFAVWSKTMYSGRNALVLGTVTLATGASLPAKIQLEKARGGWLVSRVDLKLTGAAFQAVQHLPK